MTLMEGNQIAGEKAQTQKQLAEELDNIREELRIQRENGRREP